MSSVLSELQLVETALNASELSHGSSTKALEDLIELCVLTDLVALTFSRTPEQKLVAGLVSRIGGAVKDDTSQDVEDVKALLSSAESMMYTNTDWSQSTAIEMAPRCRCTLVDNIQAYASSTFPDVPETRILQIYSDATQQGQFSSQANALIAQWHAGSALRRIQYVDERLRNNQSLQKLDDAILEALSARERLCLFHGTSVTAEAALGMQHEQLTYDLLVSTKVCPVNLTVAGVGPSALKRMGLSSVSQLRRMGFDALYLEDQNFVNEAVAEFGSDEIVNTYLASASDAVAIAGGDGGSTLGISASMLLQQCAGAAQEAFAVLQQLPAGSLEGVSASVLLDTGLRKKALGELGYSLTAIVSQTKANAAELGKLGFGIR